jgi:hypothetical protein
MTDEQTRVIAHLRYATPLPAMTHGERANLQAMTVYRIKAENAVVVARGGMMNKRPPSAAIVRAVELVEQGWTQKAAAKACGVAQSTVSTWVIEGLP